MGYKFKIQYFEIFKDRPFIKVYPAYQCDILSIKNIIETLNCVKKVNISNDKNKDLTVYPNPAYNIKDVHDEIENALKYSITDLNIKYLDQESSKSNLNNYPDVKEHLEKGIRLLDEGKELRIGLDELRIALEVLCKNIFNNEKNLENQVNLIKERLTSKGLDKGSVDMFEKILGAYKIYNNTCVKHDSGKGLTKAGALFIEGEIISLIMALL